MNHSDILSIMQLDCFRILTMLNKKDVGNVEIARILGVERSAVRRWKAGVAPGDPSARRLVALFELYYPEESTPMRE
jgi:DNA-binding transcriptional regulator YiaG